MYEEIARSLLRYIIAENPEATGEELFEQYVDAVGGDKLMLQAAANNVCQEKPIGFDYVMPSGKTLGESTYRDVEQAHEFTGRLAVNIDA